MAEERIFYSHVFNKSWTESEWRAQWNELQHWRYTNEMGFTYTVHDTCKQKESVCYTGNGTGYSIYTFGWAGRWYFSSFVATDTSAWSGPWIDPFIGKHPGFATEREAVAECFAQMLDKYQDKKIKSALQKGLRDFRAHEVTQLKLF